MSVFTYLDAAGQAHRLNNRVSWSVGLTSLIIYMPVIIIGHVLLQEAESTPPTHTRALRCVPFFNAKASVSLRYVCYIDLRRTDVAGAM